MNGYCEICRKEKEGKSIPYCRKCYYNVILPERKRLHDYFKKKTTGETMAKRRFGKRGGFRGFFSRRKGRRSSTGSTNPLKILIPAFAYGAIRAKVSDMAAPLVSKIPLGQYADEAAFGIAGYFMAKKGKGLIHNLGVAVLTVEAASVGHQLIGGMISNGSSGSGVTFYG